jgi:nitrite reductase (NADH) large subunit
MPHYVILGNGVAGTKAATAIRSASPTATITILSADDSPFYLRPKLADFVAGKVQRDALAARKPDFYSQNKLDLRLGTEVTGVDATSHRLSLANGTSLPYDFLLIAAGGRPLPASFPGADLDGMISLKTLADAQSLKGRLANAKRVVVVGESLLGLEMARACRQSGLAVTYLLRGRRFWPEILDDDAADLVERRLQDNDVVLVRNASIMEALGSGGRLRYVITNDGATLQCDLLCLGLGLQPDIGFLQGSGIATSKGVLVDEFMTTNLPDVFAAGDAVEQTSGLDYGWLRAWEQGALAGANMTGAKKRYSRVPILSMQAFGLDLMAIGQSNPQGSEYRSLSNDPAQAGVYKKLVLKDDEVVGALLVGDIGDASAVERLVREKALIGKVDPALTKRLFDPYYWQTSGQEILCPVCKFGIRLGTEAKAGDTITCPICGEEFTLVSSGGRLLAKRT